MHRHSADISDHFILNGYVLVPDAVSDAKRAQLELAFLLQVHAGVLLPFRTPYRDRTDYYNCSVFNGLLLELLPVLEDVAQEQLWPTYSYARIYRRGASLKPHLDRAACEITASITLSTSSELPWPICLESRTGEAIAIGAGPGDLVVFQGTELKHWRDQLQGERQLQLFLHYVRKAGPFSHLRFDARP